MSDNREELFQRVQQQLKNEDYTGWFETLYSGAALADIPWANLTPNRWLKQWAGMNTTLFKGTGKSALIVGCGAGDDAEFFAKHGFNVTAFDIAPSAIAACKARFPDSSVDYQVADMFNPPDNWQQAFDVVYECYTVQALPLKLREQSLKQVASFVAPGGNLLFICFARPDDVENPSGPPWGIARKELNTLLDAGLQETNFESFVDENGPGEQRDVTRFRVLYTR